jgi:hypothetical protein
LISVNIRHIHSRKKKIFATLNSKAIAGTDHHAKVSSYSSGCAAARVEEWMKQPSGHTSLYTSEKARGATCLATELISLAEVGGGREASPLTWRRLLMAVKYTTFPHVKTLCYVNKLTKLLSKCAIND